MFKYEININIFTASVRWLDPRSLTELAAIWIASLLWLRLNKASTKPLYASKKNGLIRVASLYVTAASDVNFNFVNAFDMISKYFM